MGAQILYSVLAASVVTASAWGLSTAALDYAPKGAAGEIVRKYVVAPGDLILERLEDRKDVRRLRKAGKKRMKKARKQLEKGAEKLDDKLGDLEVGGGVPDAVREKTRGLAKLYNVCSWAVVGFALCLALTVVLGVSSLKSALALGVKVTFLMIFLQGALVFAGILAVQRLMG